MPAARRSRTRTASRRRGTSSIFSEEATCQFVTARSYRILDMEPGTFECLCCLTNRAALCNIDNGRPRPPAIFGLISPYMSGVLHFRERSVTPAEATR